MFTNIYVSIFCKLRNNYKHNLIIYNFNVNMLCVILLLPLQLVYCCALHHGLVNPLGFIYTKYVNDIQKWLEALLT